MRTILGTILAALVATAITTGCGPTNTSPDAQFSKVRVVAAEAFWGSIAEQLGGNHAEVVSIIDNPNTDPHDYEATTANGRTFAQAQLAIINGVGYDPWAQKLLDANPNNTRSVIDVGNLVHAENGENPHRWYSPTDVGHVINAITDELKKLDPTHSAYFDAQESRFTDEALSQYRQLRTQIQQRYSGTAIGATESIFSPMATDLGLELITPPSFLEAISEGADPTAADKALVDQQIARKQIKVLVFNSQNSTPDVQRLIDAARANNIPVVAVSETPVPSTTSFQQWQSSQLDALAKALEGASGK